MKKMFNYFTHGQAVYSFSFDEKIVFVGTCPFTRIGHLDEIKSNSFWIGAVQGTSIVEFKLIDITETPEQAERLVANLIALYRPTCNTDGHTIARHGTRGAIICNETGVEYENANQAAKALGLAQPQLSAHLRGVPSHRSVKGYTFRRIAK